MTLPQGDLPQDAGILPTVAQRNMQEVGEFGTLPCAGVYADVVNPGTVRRGDSVYCWTKATAVSAGESAFLGGFRAAFAANLESHSSPED